MIYVFYRLFLDFRSFSGGLGTSKPSIPSNTSFKILKNDRCNFGRGKYQPRGRFWEDFCSKLGSEMHPKSKSNRPKIGAKSADPWSCVLEPFGERVYPLPYPSPRDTFDVRRQKPGKIRGFWHTSPKTPTWRGCHFRCI